MSDRPLPAAPRSGRPSARRLAAVALMAALLAAGVLLWNAGALDRVALWAAEAQRGFQRAMAGALRAIKGGEPGAIATLMGLCFAYGVAHAAGPGHGKILIGGYGLGRAVPAGRLAALALASSLAQAGTAVALAWGGLWLFDWSRARITGLADDGLAAASYAAIAAIGVYLVLRGARGLWRRAGGHAHAPDHAARHADPNGAACESCGHAHAPTPAQAAEVRSARDAALLIGGIAIRPCTGALFVLILTWSMGIPLAGLGGAVAMGLGTAAITVAVALASVSLRAGTLAALAGGSATALGRVLPLMEIAAGLAIALVAGQLLAAAL